MTIPTPVVAELTAESQGRIIGQLTGRELEIVFYLAGVGIVSGLAVVALNALASRLRKRARARR
ncbi:MAG: hypothetical protein U1E18_25355 [Brevundimonas sp.]|uniref:hypothetical protein n=1 Tax=Brevundimonas sp. TaxID=1871086 RepID=UPI0027251E9E|nr:hypothetical protein [Brevundimonas sp.]MDO9587179.1 hypothetical protein [Brevundimonas sp.]MDZ4112902.1 hypothetical protein [Brevundimonas sp.]